MGSRRKVALLVNVIAPYRVPIYEEIGKHFELTILHGGQESNRSWDVQPLPGVSTHKVFTLKLKTWRRTGVSGVRDRKYTHLNFGLLYWLPKLRPDILISNEMGLRSWIAAVYGLLMRKPVWIWSGGTPLSEANVGVIRKWNRKMLLKLCSRWICYGAAAKRYLIELGVPEAQILQIQNCVPEANFSEDVVKEEWFNDVQRPVLLTIGQLTDRKGIDRLIGACARAQQRGHQFTLAIVGRGPRRNELMELAQRIGLANVHFLPEQTQRSVNSICRSADVFVFPTLEDIWGLVVNEAVLCGTPVLCSTYAGCAEELIDPQNVFDPLQEQSFDDALDLALLGRVKPASQERLWSCDEVARSVVASIGSGEPVSRDELKEEWDRIVRS